MTEGETTPYPPQRASPDTSSDGFGDDAEEAVLPARPYVLTSGRTKSTVPLDVLSLVQATGTSDLDPAQLRIAYAEVLQRCQAPTAVAEIAARTRQSVTVTKVLLGDLIRLGAVVHSPPPSSTFTNDQHTLEAVLAGLRQLV